MIDRPDVECRDTRQVLDVAIDVIDWTSAVDKLIYWGGRHESRAVYLCNVHSVVTARQDSLFREVVERADMAAPDGAPVAWMLRRLGALKQERISGPDLLEKYCEQAANHEQSVYFYGSDKVTLSALVNSVEHRFPGLRIVGAVSPPYRLETDEEDEVTTRIINESQASVVFVGLGCPKQEKWIDLHRGRVNAVMVGVGAAFDYHAGVLRRAPPWMQRSGLEWLFRLGCEPRRLWRRYFVTNTRFIWFCFWKLVRRS